VEFTKKPVSAWGGLAAIIGKFLEQVGFQQWVESSLPFHETSNNTCGEYSKVLSHVLTVFSGGERFSHMQWWQHGIHVFEQTFGVHFAKASSSLTRFWNKFDRQRLCEHWGDRCRDFARQLLQAAEVSQGNLNLDSSVLTRYGEQQGAHKGYNPHKHGRRSHHPLLAFVCSGFVVNLWNRSGDTGSGQGCIAFFDQTMLALSGVFQVGRVLCDSGFYRVEFLNYLENKGYSYSIATPITPVIQQEIFKISCWERIEDGLEAADFFFEHKDKKWDKKRRYVVIRQSIEKRPNATGKWGKQMVFFEEYEEYHTYRYSVLVTNDISLQALEVWRQYRPRANDENVIKDLKEGLGFKAFNVDSFWATEAIMVMTALVAYNLLHYLDRKIINRGKRSQQAKTIRNTWFIIPGQLGNSGGYYRLRIAVQNQKIRAKLFRILSEIIQLPLRLSNLSNCIAVRPP